MNNWRLLLLAVVAVFQPIASFTDSNLIDGRQCCDRLSSAPLQDTRFKLHGTYRLGKTTPALRLLNDRDETREDRRYELRQRDFIYSHPPTERPLVDIRGRVVRKGLSVIARSSRVEHRLDRATNSPSRGRLLVGHQREDTARKVIERTSRDALERRNDRAYTESSQDRLFRDDHRTKRFGNERLSKNLFDTQRELQREQIRSVARRIILNRDARRVLGRTQDDVRIEASNMNNRQRIANERMSAVRRESSIRPDVRRYSDHNDERRDLQPSSEVRQTLSANTRAVDRIRDMPNRLNARGDIRENDNAQNIRNVANRREIRQNERLTRETRDENRDNVEQRLPRERILINRRDIRESRIINARNTRDVADRRGSRDTERMTRGTRDENRANLEQRLSRERIQMERRDIRESRLINARNSGDAANRRESRDTERMTKKTRDENMEQRLSRERIQMERKDILESRLINARNTRDVANRREIRQNDRRARDTRAENKENLDQRFSREIIEMDRRDIRESRLINARNTRDVADRRGSRDTERMTREARDENMEQRLSRERIQMERRDIRESRLINARNTRDVAVRREIRHNDRLARDTRAENKENLDQRLSRERIEMDRRDIRESRLINARNTRDVADRRGSRDTERMTRETRDENMEQRLSRERIQMERRDIRDSRNTQTVKRVVDRREMRHGERNTRNERENHINRLERFTLDRRNVRDRHINNKRESRFGNSMSREIRDENRESREERLSREKIQADRRNTYEIKMANNPNHNDIGIRQKVRYTTRSTEIRTEARLNPEQRISGERIQMDRRNMPALKNMNIVIRTERAVDSRRIIRNDEGLPMENRVNPDNRLVRERFQTDRRNTYKSRIGNTPNIRDLDNRHERESRETREQENTDRTLAREIRQVDRRNTRESRINRIATYEKSIETGTDGRREIRNNEWLSGQMRSDRATRERRLESRSADRVNVERDSSMMDRRARSADRRNFREIRAVPSLSRFTDTERRSEAFRSRVDHSHNIENREQEVIDARSRNVEMVRNRERSFVMVGKMETESDFTVANWQYVLYTLQAAYFCALFMQMLTPSRTEKAHKMSLRWLPVSSHYNPIKVD